MLHSVKIRVVGQTRERGGMTVEMVRAAAAARRPDGVGALLGMETEAVEEGRVVFTLLARDLFTTMTGTVDAGVLTSALDSVMGMAALTALPEGSSAPTLTLEVKFLRPVATDAGILRAEGVVVHAGRRVVTAEGSVVGPDGRLFATATTTCVVM